MLVHYLKLGAVFSVLLLVVSCQQDGPDAVPVPEPPLLNLKINNADNLAELIADVGDTIYLSAAASADAHIKTFAGYWTIEGATEVFSAADVDSASTSASMDSLMYICDYTLAGKEVSFLFVVTDQLDLADSVSFRVRVNESPLSITEGIQLGAYWHKDLGNFYNILEDTAYFPANLKTSLKNQGGVDFIVSFNNLTRFSISSSDDPNAPTIWSEQLSPVQWPFQVVNRTRFLLLDSAFNYDAIVTSAQLETVFEGDSILQTVSSVSNGQHIAFKLDRSRNDKIGILQVVSTQGNTNDIRSITFNLKIQQ